MLYKRMERRWSPSTTLIPLSSRYRFSPLTRATAGQALSEIDFHLTIKHKEETFISQVHFRDFVDCNFNWEIIDESNLVLKSVVSAWLRHELLPISGSEGFTNNQSSSLVPNILNGRTNFSTSMPE